jgi:hypothetical protein
VAPPDANFALPPLGMDEHPKFSRSHIPGPGTATTESPSQIGQATITEPVSQSPVPFKAARGRCRADPSLGVRGEVKNCSFLLWPLATEPHRTFKPALGSLVEAATCFSRCPEEYRCKVTNTIHQDTAAEYESSAVRYGSKLPDLTLLVYFCNSPLSDDQDCLSLGTWQPHLARSETY